MTDPTPSSDVWTVQRILDWTTAHLRKHGSESPRLEAEILLAHARGCRRIELYTRFDEALSDAERATMRDLVQRRTKHEPVAYLVGQREFFGLPFRVTKDVLIPRPDTETLVMEALDALKPLDRPRALDLCTGSGCVGVAIAKTRKECAVTAIDLSEAALAIARENAERNGVAAQLTFLQGDLFLPLESTAQFDVIASNPPYVRDDEMETLPPDVRLHEPRLALAAGKDGLDVLRRIVAEAPRFLAAGGRLLMELAPEQGEAVKGLLESQGEYEEVRLVKDLSRQVRVASARKARGPRPTGLTRGNQPSLPRK